MLPGPARADQCQTHVDPPEPAVELEHRRRGWGHCVSSVLKREGYRETYPLSATAGWEGTQTVLKGAQTGRGASTRAATWDITWEYKWEKTLFIFREVKHWNRSPEGWLDFHPWRCSKLFCAWPWATWSDGTQAGQQDGLGDLCKSPPTYMILWSHLATSCFSGAKRQCFFVSPSPQQQMIQTWKTE